MSISLTPEQTTPEQTRQRFAEAVERDGKELAAARLGCSVTHVIYVCIGKRDVGLQLAGAIEEAYGIKMQDWVEWPAARQISTRGQNG